jgi:hypothetical protein
VECQSRCDREYGKDGGRPTGTKSQDENRYIPDLGLGEALSDYRAVFSGGRIGDLRQAEGESFRLLLSVVGILERTVLPTNARL